MNAFSAGSNADISAHNIDVNPTLLSKNQSKQFTLNEGQPPSSFNNGSSYVPVSAMSGIAGLGSDTAPGGRGLKSASGISGGVNDVYSATNNTASG